MPVKVQDSLPALALLEREGVQVIPESRAFRQDIRPLRIAVLNLMPQKVQTETQLLRLLGYSPLQVSVVFLRTGSYVPTHTPPEHLERFYTTFEALKEERFDGLIITGAPVETLEFEQVAYWEELRGILEWSKSHVYSTMHICWGAQAGLYYHHGVQKRALPEKAFGVFLHRAITQSELLRGHDEQFWAPHSRHAGVYPNDLVGRGLRMLAYSDEVGAYMVANKDERQVFILGHPEYDRWTLAEEYARDVEAGLNIQKPQGPEGLPHAWRSHAHLLFCNWLSLIYQHTPHDLAALEPLAP